MSSNIKMLRLKLSFFCLITVESSGFDEVHLNKRSHLTQEWLAKRNNVAIVENQMIPQPKYLVGAVSLEFGLERYIISDNHINSRTFCDKIPKIKANDGDYDIAGDSAT